MRRIQRRRFSHVPLYDYFANSCRIFCACRYGVRCRTPYLPINAWLEGVDRFLDLIPIEEVGDVVAIDVDIG